MVKLVSYATSSFKVKEETMSELNEHSVFEEDVQQHNHVEHEGTCSSIESSAEGDALELIQRMVREASLESSAVAAALQINGGDLLEMSLAMKPSIIDALKKCRDSDDFKELQPWIDTYVKVSRQADRVLRLKQEITQSQSANCSVTGAKIA